ncbi:ABC transporter permease [Rossellomorea marisflavi]|uniref:ABC transporter permease n=1 Tax=Rossellomorea marisflavi TaxID=189381 RepID=UPI003FA10DA2
MLNLMKLEWTKNRLYQYWKGVLVSIILIFAAMALMGIGSNGEKEAMFPDYEAYESLAGIFVRIVFMIYTSVVLSKVMIEEFRNKTIQLLFTYPTERKKILRAKLLVVFGFCFVITATASIAIALLTVGLNPMLEIFPGQVTFQDIAGDIPGMLLMAFMMGGVSLIPLFFGMRKKSTATTITSAVLIGFLINATVSDGSNQTSLFQFIGVPVGMCLIGFGIAFLSYRRIEKADL